MAEPLTQDHFDKWREQEFVPHTLAEAEYERKVDRLDTQLSLWLKLVSIGMTFGGVVLGLFLWILLEKNTQLGEMQKAVVAINVEHGKLVTILDEHTRELQRQMEIDKSIMVQLNDNAKLQIQIMADLYKRMGAGGKP